jgi:hypothetical protein
LQLGGLPGRAGNHDTERRSGDLLLGLPELSFGRLNYLRKNFLRR